MAKQRRQIMKNRILLLALGTGAVAIAFPFFMNSGFRFFQKATGVELPPNTTEMKSKNYNGFNMGTARISKSEITTFVERYTFKPVSSLITRQMVLEEPTKYPNLNGYTSELDERLAILSSNLFYNNKDWPSPNNHKDMLYIRGMREKWPWEYVLDPNTGQLWIYVREPDSAGD